MAGEGPPSTTMLILQRKVVDGPPARAMTVSAAGTSKTRTPSITGLGRNHPVHLRRGAAVQCLLLRSRCIRGDPLERVPQLGIAAGLLVRREVALEHAAVDAERLDAGLDVLTPRGRQVLRGRRQLALVEVEAERHHADPTQLAVDVRAFGEFDDVPPPGRQLFLPPP